jgi:predicted MFS family arabinose efflux permease
MRKYLNQSAIGIQSERYITLIVVLAPLLNFLAGINVDIYSPSMPVLTSYFHTSIAAVKDTLSASLLGWTIGAFGFGILIDNWGRKRVLLFGLSLYVLASMLAPFCQSINQLIVIRFFQGLFVASITIGCRALIVDNIQGPRYAIAILYTSIGYGLGPIIGPFIGSWLQHFIGWHADFIALALISFTLLLTLFLFIEESNPQKQPLALHDISQRFLSVLKHRTFMTGVLIGGLIQIQIMLYPVLGPFIVEMQLHKSVLAYGNSALAVGAGYLIGNLIGRFLLMRYNPKQVCYLGFVVLSFTVLLAYLFAACWPLNLITLMIPIILLCISSGLIFAHVMGANLRQFPNNLGAAMALQSTGILLFGALGVFITSRLHIANLHQFANLYMVLAALLTPLFFFLYRGIFDT